MKPDNLNVCPSRGVTAIGRIAALFAPRPWLTALVAAVLFNFDRIFLPRYALLRIHDTFDSAFPFLNILAENIRAFGFQSQFPQILGGVTAYLMGGFGSFLLLPYLVLPPYAAYAVISTAVFFVAFIGMYLLLRDCFRMKGAACAAGALIFSCQDVMPISEGFSIYAAPLLIWALENVFTGSGMARRLGSYAFVLLYFAGSLFAVSAMPVAIFYAAYFVFVSKIPKSTGNIALMALIWLQYPLFNLPVISELLALGPESHRMTWLAADAPAWADSLRFLVSSVFSLGFYSFVPFLGVVTLAYYLAHGDRGKISREAAFVFSWTVGLALFLFWFIKTPAWAAFKGGMGFLRTFQLERLGLLLSLTVPASLAVACDFLLKEQGRFSSRKAWRMAGYAAVFYALAAVYYNGLDLPFFSLGFWNLRRTHALMENCQRLTFFVHFLPVLLFAYLVSRKKSSVPAAYIVLAPWFLFSILGAVNNRLYWQTNNRLNTYRNTFESDQIDTVKKMENGNLSGFRVVSSGGYDTAPLNSGFLCADGYAMLYPQTYKEFWAKMLEPEILEHEAERNYFLGWGSRAYLFNWTLDNTERVGPPFNDNLLKLLGVKYLFFPERLRNPEEFDLDEVLIPPVLPEGGPGENHTLVSKAQFQLCRILRDYSGKKQLWVYKNREYAGLAFLTGGVSEFHDKDALLEAMGRADYRGLISRSFVYSDATPSGGWGNLDVQGALIKTAEHYPDRIKIRLSNQHPVILNVSRNYDSNWLCAIDGVPATVFSSYHAFLGVRVPAGSSDIDLRLDTSRPTSAYTHALAGLLLANLIILPIIIRSRGYARAG